MSEGQQMNSFVAGVSNPLQSEDAASLLQLARDDGYEFVTTSLPYASPASSSSTSSSSALGSSALVRRDVVTLESKWWSTSVVGTVADPPGFPPPSTPSTTATAAAAAAAPGTGSPGGSADMMMDTSTGNASNSGSTGDAAGGTAASEVASPGEGLIAALCHPTDNNTTATAASSSRPRLAERYLTFMLDWAAHMTIPAVIFPPPPPDDDAASVHYARVLQTLALNFPNIQFWIRTPIKRESIEAFDLLHRRSDALRNISCLLYFDSAAAAGTVAPTTATPASASPAAAAAAAAAAATAGNNVGKAMTLIHQVVGSNLKAVSFSTSSFLTNKRGYPTLSKSHQVLFTELLRRLGRTLRVLVEGPPLHHPPDPTQDAEGRTGSLAYLQYLRHLRMRSEVVDALDSEESQMELTYLDHLQSPLQPLGDDLEFQTYETFEKDPVKYTNYGIAIQLAIRDGISLGRIHKHTSPNSKEDVYQVTILVVGAGRGPLVRAALEACENVHRTLSQSATLTARIVAVEKNASAVLYLRSLLSREPQWERTVQVAECDVRMAKYHPLLSQMAMEESTRADIVVSELLGSFGDNELSPECLDGVQHSGLMKETCVSIPQRYTAYLAPVSSMRLFAEAQEQSMMPMNPNDGPGGRSCGTLQAMETPYVVRSHSASQTHKELPCWEFVHPAPTNTTNSHSNERWARLMFPSDATLGAGYGSGYGPLDTAVAAMASSGVNTTTPSTNTTTPTSSQSSLSLTSGGISIHGFLGTFRAILYQSPLSEKDSSTISTAPRTFSPGMFSWFPLYFPLRSPLYVPDGAGLTCSIWRRTSTEQQPQQPSLTGGNVWYEWCAEVFVSGEDDGGKKVLATTPIHNPNGRSYRVRL